MSQRYPHPCNRCGLCCMMETCIVAQKHFGIPKTMPCPALSMEGEQAHCGLVELYSERIMGIGAGCCIDAKVVTTRDGKHYETRDFASLPDRLKTQYAQARWTLFITQNTQRTIKA